MGYLWQDSNGAPVVVPYFYMSTFDIENSNKFSKGVHVGNYEKVRPAVPSRAATLRTSTPDVHC